MKRLGFSLVLAASVAWFAACSFEAPAMGHLSISIPAAASAKSLSGARSFDALSNANNPAIRIYVVLNGSFINFSGKSYYQAALTAASSTSSSSNTLTIDLAPSNGYKVYVALGSAPAGGGWEPLYYGATDSFTISSGTVTNVSLTAVKVAFTTEASSTAAQVAFVNNTLYRLLGPDVQYMAGDGTFVPIGSYSGDFKTFYSFSSGEWFSGANSFSPEAWINTDTGIWAVSTSPGLVQRSSYVGVGALASGAVTGVTANGQSNCLLLLSYGNGDVRYAYSNGYDSSSWTNGGLKDYLNSDSTLSKLIPDPSSFVKASAFATNGTTASTIGFISTGLGCFFYNGADSGDIAKDPVGWIKNQVASSDADTISAISGGKSQVITSLALDDASSPAYVYGGTKAGLYRCSADVTTGTEMDQLSSGSAVLDLAAFTFGGFSYVAYVDAQGNLAVLKVKGQNVTPVASYPFYSYCSAPGSVTSLAFYTSASGANLYLAVASSDSYAAIPVAAVSPD